MLIWNDLAGGDGDYCAILVAFNSILQMVLYAPFAIFYINVIKSPDSDADAVTVSYSVVAQSVAVFLGTHPYFSTENRTNSNRHPTRCRSSDTINIITHPRPRPLPASLYQLHLPPLPHRSPLHRHNPLRLPRPQRCKPNHPRPARRSPSHLLFCHHIS